MKLEVRVLKSFGTGTVHFPDCPRLNSGSFKYKPTEAILEFDVSKETFVGSNSVWLCLDCHDRYRHAVCWR